MNIRKVNKWLKENDFDVKIRKGNDYSYEFADDIINVAEANIVEMWDYYLYCYKLGLCYPVDLNILSLLHEIGHHETLLELNDTLCSLDMFLEKIINKLPNGSIRNKLYYRLPTEKAATKWAIDYIRNNVDKVMDLERIIWTS